MKNRNDYRIIPNFYSTNALAYILYNDTVIDFVETLIYTIIPNDDPTKVKMKKTKRDPSTYTAEAERKINKHIKNE